MRNDKKEQIKNALCTLYEQYGYRAFRMRSFESYDFYSQHRDFLSEQTLLTFQDLDGTLLALKPDITLSIVKNWDAHKNEKLYYSENVYRPARQTREYRELTQIGVEYLGKVSTYTQVEMLTLALRSLSMLDNNYALDVSHLGFISPLLDRCHFKEESRQQALFLLSQKNAHELKVLCEKENVGKEEAEDLCALLQIAGPVPQAMKRAQKLIRCAIMEEALKEIETIYQALSVSGLNDSVHMDFSLVNSMRYYNALIFAGYLPSLSRAVLTGGRYDLLPQSMGKKDGEAIGFAISMDEVERMFRSPQNTHTDILLLYNENTPLDALQKMVQNCVQAGKSVRVEEEKPDNFTYTECLCYHNGRWEEAKC